MAKKKTTLDTLAGSLAKLAGEMRKGFAKQGAAIENLTASTGKQGKEIHDLTSSVTHVVTSVGRIEQTMATEDDVAKLRTELKGDIAAVHTQVNSIERQLRDTKTEIRLADLEEKVFGQARR